MVLIPARDGPYSNFNEYIVSKLESFMCWFAYCKNTVDLMNIRKELSFLYSASSEVLLEGRISVCIFEPCVHNPMS